MRIRTMTDDDLTAAFALWAATDHLGPVPPDEVAALRAHHPELVLVARSDAGDLAGVVLGSFDGRRGWVSRLAVDGAYRRTGIGAALTRELERRLAALGCVQVNLLVYAANASGRGFWHALGFAATDDVVLFSKRLDDPGVETSC